MTVFKRALARRTVLKGIGATIALPLLDSMVPAFSAQAKRQFRFGAIYTPHGAYYDLWRPQTEGTNFDLPQILQPLAPVKDRLVVVSGLAEKNVGTVHLTASAMYLNGVVPKKTEGADVQSGTTVDQYIAAHIGQDTVLPSIEWATEDMGGAIGSCDSGYSCLYQSTISWRTPEAPLPMELNPRALFERVFGDGGTLDRRLARMKYQRSILDSVTQEARRLQGRLGASDAVRVSEFLDNIREVEQRIQRSEKQTDARIELPAAPSGIPDTFEEHVQLLLDITVLAFQADVTRVFTGMFGVEATFRSYPEIGVPDGHHFVSHHGGNPDIIAKHVKIQTYHYLMLSKFLQKLQSIPDGDGTLLDNSLILYGSGLGEANVHARDNLPLVVAGAGAGTVKGYRHLSHPRFTPHTNLLLAIAEKAGVELDHIGDSNGRVDL